MRDDLRSRVTGKGRAAALVAVGLLAAPGLRAEDPKPAETPAFTINGFVSGSYSYRFDEPPSGRNGFRVFDFDDNTFKPDVAELVVQRTTPNAGDVGFRMDLTAGASIPPIAAASGLFRDPETGESEDFDLQQAYVSWNAPVGRGLRFDFGKHITHMGYEVIEGYDGWNDNYSRSLLFGYAIPFTHTGLKVTYAGEKASVMGMVVNGWDNVKDNNRGKSIGAQLLLTPSKTFSLYLNWMGGPERADSSDRRNDYNVVAVVKPGRLILAADYVYGREKGARGLGLDGTWQALAGYLRLNPSDRIGLTLRGEWFDDPDGVRTGFDQKLKEATFTPEFKIGAGFVLRGDLRYDRSDASVFEGKSGSKKDQTTVAVNALYSF